MGNSSIKFDMISTAPPEVVLLIVSRLSLVDVTNCLLVCQSWYAMISNLGPYWQNLASSILGLHADIVLVSAPLYATRRDFYIAACRHRRRVRSWKFICQTIPVSGSTILEEGFTQFFHSKGNMVVRTQKKFHGQDNILMVEKLEMYDALTSSGIPGFSLEPVYSFVLNPISKVAWTYLSEDEKYLFWVTRSGIWKGHNLLDDREVFSWIRNILKEGQGVTFSCCRECFLVLIAHWTPVESGSSCTSTTYSLQIVSMGDKEGMKPKEHCAMKTFTVHHTNHSVCINHDSRHWLREAYVQSLSLEKCEGACQCHRFVLQCDCCVVIQDLVLPDVMFSEAKCVNCNTLEESKCKILNIRRTSSKFSLTTNGTKLGMILNHKLHVWKVTETSTCKKSPVECDLSVKLLTSARLSSNASNANAIELVELGHIYTIIAYVYDTFLTDYRLCVVSTSTGDLLTEYRRVAPFPNWTTCCHVDPLHRYYFMFGEDGREWVSDVRWSVPDVPLVVLHNHHGRIHLEAVIRKPCNDYGTKLSL